MEQKITLRLTIAILVLSILSVAASSSFYSCPSVCTCYVDDHGFRTANCTGVKFLSEYKFNKLFHEIEVLNIEADSDDDPTILWDDMFSSFTKLKVLNLSKCKINHLPKNVFKGLKKIYEINLSYNNIRHFDNLVFENSYTLNKLSLRGNPLQATYKPFISSVSLRELDLGYCSLTVLQNEYFHGVKKVTRLHLDGNHLQTIKEHVLPRGIIHLNLASNRIVNVPISTISSLSQLRWINLGANPVNCTCPLLNLQDRLSGRGVIIDGDVRCAYPFELENVSWSKINENELCTKEMFRSRLHSKKSQASKYIHSQKKDQYFENEKYNYNPLESFQGDEPGKSADEDYDNLLSEDSYDEPKDTKTDIDTHTIVDDSKRDDALQPDEDKDLKEANVDDLKKESSFAENPILQGELDEAKPQNLIENEKIEDVTLKPQPEVEILSDVNTTQNKLEKQIGSISEEKDNKPQEVTSSNSSETSENKNNLVVEEKTIETNARDTNEKEISDGAGENDEDSTALPMTTDPDFIISDPEIAEKSNLDNLDEGLKREDEILPVVESPHNESTETDDTKNTDSGKINEHIKNSVDVYNDTKDGTDLTVQMVENETNKTTDDTVPKISIIEPPMVSKNESEYFSVNKNDLEDSSGIKDHQDLNAAPNEETERENKENLLNQNEEIITNRETQNSVVSENKTEQFHDISSTVATIGANEGEGSGDHLVSIPGINISTPGGEEGNKELESSTIPSSETSFISSIDSSGSSSGNDDIGNESSQQVIDKSSMTYEEIGPYIVIIGIIILVTVLIFVSVYKTFCKSNKSNEKPVTDVEANNGTELQDMKSLLPKTQVNGEKHNNKYPNEVPSPETVNLIKEDKTDDSHELNEAHDLNQNDNKNEHVIKNGKAQEGSPPPVEITKAKLTVLLESIPRTPIFVQKRSTTINNG